MRARNVNLSSFRLTIGALPYQTIFEERKPATIEYMPTAFLLIAHGSRQAEANADLHHLAEKLRGRINGLVEAAFLELAEPTIAEAAQRCVDQGADRIILLPYFLSAGFHVLEDLQNHRRRLADQFPTALFH